MIQIFDKTGNLKTNVDINQPITVDGTFWQSIQPISIVENSILFKGKSSTFRTPGRAGTVGQKIMSLYNSTDSSVIVKVKNIVVDLVQTVVKAATVSPPIVRIFKVSILPSNGTVLIKNKIDGITTSNSSVVVLGDSSADGVGSGTTLTGTLPTGAILEQQFASRLISVAGQEAADKLEFFKDSTIKLEETEGIVIFLDYTLATQNPLTDMWIASLEWEEILI